MHIYVTTLNKNRKPTPKIWERGEEKDEEYGKIQKDKKGVNYIILVYSQ